MRKALENEEVQIAKCHIRKTITCPAQPLSETVKKFLRLELLKNNIHQWYFPPPDNTFRKRVNKMKVECPFG